MEHSVFFHHDRTASLTEKWGGGGGKERSRFTFFPIQPVANPGEKKKQRSTVTCFQVEVEEDLFALAWGRNIRWIFFLSFTGGEGERGNPR